MLTSNVIERKGVDMAKGKHRALKVTGVILGIIVGLALIAVVALNLYIKVGFA